MKAASAYIQNRPVCCGHFISLRNERIILARKGDNVLSYDRTVVYLTEGGEEEVGFRGS